MSDQAIAALATVTYRRDKDYRGKGDPRFLLDFDASPDVKIWDERSVREPNDDDRKHKRGVSGNPIVILKSEDGDVTVRQTLRRNVYVPGGESFETVTQPYGAPVVTRSAATASANDSGGTGGTSLQDLVAIGDEDIVAAYLRNVLGMGAKAAKAKATKLCK